MKEAPTTPHVHGQLTNKVPVSARQKRFAVPPYLVLIAMAFLLAETFVLYGQSINLSFVSDDWPLLEGSRLISSVLSVGGGYHYTPLSQLLIFVLFSLFGLQVAPYHLIALTLFFLGGSLESCLAWQL